MQQVQTVSIETARAHQQARIYTTNLIDQALQKELEQEANQAPAGEVGSARRALNIAYGLGLKLQEEIDHLAAMAGIDCHHHAQHLATAIHTMIIEALCQLSEVGEPATARPVARPLARA